MRIHLITNLFAPDELAGAALFSDLARFLKENRHDIRVTCTFPYYPAWRLRPEDRNISMREEVFEGIPVRRISMYVPEHPTGRARMISDLSFLTSLIRRGQFARWTPEVVLTASPMLSQCLAQRFLYRRERPPRFIIVQDFVVDAALDLRMLRAPGLGVALRTLERWAFRSARTLSTISPAMLAKLRQIVGDDRRLVYIPNWIHASLTAEIARGSSSRARSADVLFYSGNLGVKQGLAEFVPIFKDAAQKTRWHLHLHGDGADADRLRSRLRPDDPINVGPLLGEPQYVAKLASATACLVTQRPGVGVNFLPSKLLPALATGTPVLAVCDSGTPLGQEVKEGGFGEVLSPGDVAGLRSVLSRWSTQPEELKMLSLRARARSHLYQREAILRKYESELTALSES
jgi:colanic acid biosynthesis glycosyl transferase WcaI